MLWVDHTRVGRWDHPKPRKRPTHTQHAGDITVRYQRHASVVWGIDLRPTQIQWVGLIHHAQGIACLGHGYVPVKHPFPDTKPWLLGTSHRDPLHQVLRTAPAHAQIVMALPLEAVLIQICHVPSTLQIHAMEPYIRKQADANAWFPFPLQSGYWDFYPLPSATAPSSDFTETVVIAAPATTMDPVWDLWSHTHFVPAVVEITPYALQRYLHSISQSGAIPDPMGILDLQAGYSTLFVWDNNRIHTMSLAGDPLSPALLENPVFAHVLANHPQGSLICTGDPRIPFPPAGSWPCPLYPTPIPPGLIGDLPTPCIPETGSPVCHPKTLASATAWGLALYPIREHHA